MIPISSSTISARAVERTFHDHPVKNFRVEPVLGLVGVLQAPHEVRDPREDVAHRFRPLHVLLQVCEFARGRFEERFLERDALHRLHGVAAVMRLVDEQDDVLGLDPEREVELLPYLVVEEVVIIRTIASEFCAACSIAS